jgi:hypothetical protein
LPQEVTQCAPPRAWICKARWSTWSRLKNVNVSRLCAGRRECHPNAATCKQQIIKPRHTGNIKVYECTCGLIHTGWIDCERHWMHLFLMSNW